VTATAVCTCDADIGVPCFDFTLVGANGTIIAHDPVISVSVIDEGYGILQNGSEAQISWGSSQRWGSSATFSVTFRLESKNNQHPCIKAWCPWYDSENDFAKIYLR
jgi:hypothetical protein